MTCASCGGKCEEKTLKNATNKMLIAELKTRRESAEKQRGEYVKTHWSWSKFSYVSMLTLGAISFFAILAEAFGLQIMLEPITVISVGVVGFSTLAIAILIIFKNMHVSSQFKKEYPEEADLLSGI